MIARGKQVHGRYCAQFINEALSEDDELTKPFGSSMTWSRHWFSWSELILITIVATADFSILQVSFCCTLHSNLTQITFCLFQAIGTRCFMFDHSPEYMYHFSDYPRKGWPADCWKCVAVVTKACICCCFQYFILSWQCMLHCWSVFLPQFHYLPTFFLPFI